MSSVVTPAELKALQTASPSSTFVLTFITPADDATKHLADVVDGLEEDYPAPSVQFLQVDSTNENAAGLFDAFAVNQTPTVVAVVGTRVVGKVEGFNVPAIVALVEKAVAVKAKSPAELLQDRLKALVNSAPVILFMKGSPETPRCGFSRQIVALLKENNIQFSTFDILEDDAVRQGLKEYSNWPTYPQLYGGGELVGGLDVVKELVEAGELVDSLPQ